MFMILTGFMTMLIFAPLATMSDPLIGWMTFGAGAIAVAVGGYAELFSR